MKHMFLEPLALAAAVLGLAAVASADTAAPPVSMHQAQVLKQGIQSARERVTAVLTQAHMGLSAPLAPVLENDVKAEARLVEASDSLDKATVEADSLLAIETGKSREPVDRIGYHFAEACTKTAIAESRVTLARFAAVAPPLGKFVPFGPELEEIAQALKELRGPEAAGCP
jgi:hypothetical protein